MSATFDDYPLRRRDGVTIPTIALWVVVSLLLHVALLVGLPPLRNPSADEPVPPPLTAYLRPLPQSAPPPAPPPPAVRPPRVPAAPRAQPQAKPPSPTAKAPPEPVIALTKPPPLQPSFTVPAQPPPKPAPQAATPPPAESDLSAYIAARKRSRGEEVTAADSDNTQRGAQNSVAAKSAPTINFGEKPPTPSGGLFQMRRRGYDYAEFVFYGWNTSFGRNVPQLIEVRKGDASDIDLAVVRKIIAIIRDHERGDFTWYSKRSGKTLTLSARARDNSGLEDFMMQEFYEDLHRYR